MSLLPYLEPIAERHNLTVEQARDAMLVILRGQASQPQLAAFMMGMRMKGETVEELVGFAQAMRQMAAPVEHRIVAETLLDTCGTGGDGAGTFNISTVAAFVVAGAGVRVAKHGNRSVTNQDGCGSADLLESMGIEIALPPKEAARAIREVGIGFLFAPHVHTAMKHANPVRVDLKIRTFFNLLGPLTNPAGASAQLAGAPSERAAELIAGALATLGLQRGFVVHGWDGLDEITTTGPTVAFEIADGRGDATQSGAPKGFRSPSRLGGATQRRQQSPEFRNRHRSALGRARSAPRYRAGEHCGSSGGGRQGRHVSRRHGHRHGVDRLRRSATQSGRTGGVHT